ncbi:MAG: flagellar hook-length control protein FliK [Treponema sp.]|nr:flagellar hook-length control protein FliK [Treponema sp.]
MIAINAYTDIPFELITSEPPPVIENEGEEDQSDFAMLLAGLLQDVQDAEVSEDDSGLDALAAEKTKDGNRLNVFSNEIEKNAVIKSGAETADIDPIDAAIESKHQNILSADHLFGGSLSPDDANEEAEVFQLTSEFIQELGEQTLNELIEMASLNTEPAPNDLLAKEIPQAEKLVEKDSSFITAKTQTDTALNSQTASELAVKYKINEAAAAEDKKANITKESQSSVFDAINKNEKTEISSGKNKAGEDNNASFNRQNDNPGKLDEYRRGLKKEKVSFEVRDLRTGTNIANNSQPAAALAETAADRAPVQEITLDLRMPVNSQAQTAWDVKAPAALENMLARELHQNFNGDIVRHASMILRNGGEGIIKLALHPETLGNVKIRLEMAENKITGFIEVESKEAMNAFRKEIAALEQAFREQGFAEASLDLSLTADGEKQEFESPSFITRAAASSYEDSYEQETSSIVDVFFGRNTSSVNMLA